MTKQEIWGIAHYVLQRHGEDGGPAFIESRITDLATNSNAAGVAAWKTIAERFDALVEGQRHELRH